MLSVESLAQILAGIAFILDVVSVQLKNRTKILIGFTISCCLLSIHFYLLKQNTACALSLIGALRFSIAAKKSGLPFAFLFLTTSTTAMVLTYRTPVSLVGYCGTVFATFIHSDISNCRF